MDINELLGRATKTIGKIKGVGNDNTTELMSKAKEVVKNYKPKKQPVEEETIPEEAIMKRHPEVSVDINTEEAKEKSNSPFKYTDVELEKIKHDIPLEEPKKEVPEIKPDDRDSLENVIMMIKNISDSDPESAKKLIPITTKLLGKLGNAKFSYEDLNEISEKHF